MPPHHSPTRRLASVLLSVFAAMGAAQAENADRLKPMNAESDHLRYDDARQTSVFTGNVLITKGTIVIRGNTVEVRQDAQGNQFGTVLGSPGYFKQKREGLNEFIEGEGKRIEYDSRDEIVRFIGNAVMRRYLGTQQNDETRGNVIVYNSRTEVFTVEGAPAAGSAPGTPAGRVRATITPVNREGEQPTPAPAPSGTPLRPAGELGGARP